MIIFLVTDYNNCTPEKCKQKKRENRRIKSKKIRFFP